MDEQRDRGRMMQKSRFGSTPSNALGELRQMPVTEQEIAVVEAFLGLQFAMIFGHGEKQETSERNKVASGGSNAG